MEYQSPPVGRVITFVLAKRACRLLKSVPINLLFLDSRTLLKMICGVVSLTYLVCRRRLMFCNLSMKRNKSFSAALFFLYDERCDCLIMGGSGRSRIDRSLPVLGIIVGQLVRCRHRYALIKMLC